MPTDRLNDFYNTAMVWLVPFGLKVLGAMALWIIGRRLIHLAVSLMQRGMRRQPIDATVIGFIGSAVAVTLNIVLVVALLGFFGVETTSFAALLAGAGLAIGTAWSGLLANFAAGIFLMILRPFKTGDFVTAGGVTGTIEEIGLFATTLNTPDNIRTFVGNNKFPHVLADPAPVIEIVEFTSFGPKLAVRPFCSNDHYWQVYFDTNRVIREAFGEAGFPAPEQLVLVRQSA